MLFTFAEGDFRVSADTVIEGEIQRVVTSPFAAYVAESEVRAGDIVKQGQVLAILDDRDLKLEQIKLLGQKNQLASQYREAMANHDRAQVRITMAKSGQIQAQLDLLDYKLARTKLVAPFDGVVVSGDLSQALGAPVEKGQVIFEVAPLDAYRIILQVDERDITYLKEKQLGTLVLSSIPDEELYFTVKTITPVSTAKEGKNYFRVEAELDELSQNLRPGMEGVGKVKIGRENLFWIWTYKIINWFRLWVWSWLP
jgi:multidrug efflux pump subunit AcrA (membrane-fusion protein)